MRSFDELLKAVQGDAPKYKDLLDLDRDIREFPPDEQKILVRASFGPFLTHPRMDGEILGGFARQVIELAGAIDDDAFRRKVITFGGDALRQITKTRHRHADEISAGLFALSGGDDALKAAVLDRAVEGIENKLKVANDFCDAAYLAHDVFPMTKGFPSQREAVLTLAPAICEAIMRRRGPEETARAYLLSALLEDMRGREEDVPLLGRVTGSVLAAVETCVPDPTRGPDPAPVQLAFGLVSSHGVALKVGDGFCCQDFLLAAGHPAFSGRAVVAFYPEEPPLKQGFELARARRSLGFCASGQGRGPAPAYYNDILAVVNAVACGSVTPLPFPEAVAVHKRGGQTWPRVA